MCCRYPLFAISGYISTPTSFCEHVTTSVRSCFAALHQTLSVQRCLPQHALLTLIRALVVSMVDYCCSVLADVSGHLLDRLPPDSCSRPGAANASPRFSATFIGCGSQNGFNSVSAFWHSDMSMDQRHHILLRAFFKQQMWKVISTSAHLPPWRLLSRQCSDYSWWPYLSCRCIAGMEQPTTCHPNCFILHLLSATTEDTSV